MIVHDSYSDCVQYNIDHLYIPRRKEIYILWNILRAHLWKSAFHARLPWHLRSLHMRLPQPSDTKRIQYMSHIVNYIILRIEQWYTCVGNILKDFLRTIITKGVMTWLSWWFKVKLW